MTEAQVWTMMGVFTTLFLGTLTIISTLFVRVVRSEVGGLRGEMIGEIGGLRTEMRTEIRRLDEKIDTRFDSLDRDIQTLFRHTFGTDRP
ncbi:MAG: hypothetical protein QM635_01260 [Microbacteriaceae bacterium]